MILHELAKKGESIDVPFDQGELGMDADQSNSGDRIPIVAIQDVGTRGTQTNSENWTFAN